MSKYEGISGLWVHIQIMKNNYAKNMKKIVPSKLAQYTRMEHL